MGKKEKKETPGLRTILCVEFINMHFIKKLFCFFPAPLVLIKPDNFHLHPCIHFMTNANYYVQLFCCLFDDCASFVLSL